MSRAAVDGHAPDGRAGAGSQAGPLVYFARAVDGLDRDQVIASGREIADEVARHGFRLVDPVAAWDRAGPAADPADATSLVGHDLAVLRSSDAVLMDMSITSHQYIGCVCELTYAFLWRIPSIVWVGETGLERRSWLRYHATRVVRRRSEAVAALVSLLASGGCAGPLAA